MNVTRLLQPFVLSLLVLSCGNPPQKTKVDKQAPKPASTQAATKPADKTPHALVKLEIGDTAQTLDRLYSKVPLLISSEQLRYQLNREFKAAATEIDLTQGTEAVLGYSEDLLGFVAFSFALQKDNRFAEKIKSTPGLDTKGHQFAVRPLPNSLLSPFNHVLYLDIKDGRLFMTDTPEGLQRIPLQSGLSTSTLKAKVDFASLWYVFGMPYQEAYLAQKDERQFKSVNNEPPKPKQSDIAWEAFFITAGSIKGLDIEADTKDGVLLSVLVSTKKAITAEMDALPGDPYEMIPGSQFGFRAVVPKSVIGTIGEARRRLAPPAFDSLAMFYPLAGSMNGPLFFGGGIDPKEGFWSIGQYPITDPALARVGLQRHFSETPRPDAMFLEPGRSFTFTVGTTREKDGSTIDLVTSSLKDPSILDQALHIDSTEARYRIGTAQAITMTGKASQKYVEFFEQKKTPQVVPKTLSDLLNRKSALTPGAASSQPTASQPATSQPASSQPSNEEAPFAFFWLSQSGIANLPTAPVDAAATVSLTNGSLLVKIAMLP